ncbi:efflux RND transporter permease subunit [Shewanella sp. 202IG2-18]|uniref:efflux RND transporter permease subunit n=1 Tax=Parashewanella hymeniacidonis TaxID=2807618 RepID=UPI0019619CE7|nr:efflux RND transporter permease subunit [Parashewanella hymeniacidonis]MBM7072400.1 efflux RND transporter permease subunit [Parashewanella hymeniacidonis]
MNIAQFSIERKVISWMFVLILLIGGAISFTGLGQLEFPEFTIKQALVNTVYPGASPEQVEEEVTLPLEDAIQQLDAVKHVKSVNSAGLSQIEIEVYDSYGPKELPQVWDEVRRKVNDLQGQFPQGVQKPQVIDYFGDVFGLLYNLNGDGYTSRELKNYADFLRRELVLIDGVKKVSVTGNIPQQIFVEISPEKLVSLGLSPASIFRTIQQQNVVSNAGSIRIDNNRIRIHPTGEFKNIDDLRNLLVSPPNSTKLVYLKDIAKVYKGYSETPRVLYHNQGEPAISVGISFASGVNVVDVGNAVKARLTELKDRQPLGMELNKIYDQAQVVDTTVTGFVINLAESVAIVIGVLLLFMGVRSGILMGLILLLSILGTFIVMKVMGIELQIISLGALIIALGMLVDNAIVVTEGVIIGLKRGQTRLQAAKGIVSQTQWPLLGATVIAIIAFAPIGLSQNAAGEFCRSLFYVLLISLFISWITAITLTPFFCNIAFKDGEQKADDGSNDPYKGIVFTVYGKVLSAAIHHRAVTILLIVAALGGAIAGFGHIKNVFFPASNTPIFFVDVWLPEGTDIKANESYMQKIEKDILTSEAEHKNGVENLTTVIGQGAQRFVLPYAPEKGYAAYSQLLIEMKDLDSLKSYMPRLQDQLRQKYPEAEFRFKPLENGPSPAAKIEARFYGDDPIVLRELAAKAGAILKAEPTADNVRQNWRNQVMIIRPQIAAPQAHALGITKTEIDDALHTNYSGKVIGSYRETSHIYPVVARAPQAERQDADSVSKIQVWSNKTSSFVPLNQVVSEFKTEWENPLIVRRDRKRMIAVMADPKLGVDETADSVFRKVRDKVEQIKLPHGYKLEWGGEYESAGDAQKAVFSSIPMGYLGMFLITVLLFNSVRQPLVIWCTVPLSIIGIVAGLLLFDAPFSFMALLGMLSLTGMVIKNGIVLVDQINLELSNGKEPYAAVIDSSVSRVRPVLMAAITTMLGMLPLISDAFFGSMAITIIFGLGFASILTLLIVPVLYTVFFKIRVRA